MRLYKNQWRVSGVIPKMPSANEVRGECRARIGASVRFARGANVPYTAPAGLHIYLKEVIIMPAEWVLHQTALPLVSLVVISLKMKGDCDGCL